MKTFGGTAGGAFVSVIVTFIVTWVLGTFAEYATMDKGAVGISRAVPIDGKILSVVTISNYSKEFLNEIALEIPVEVPTNSLFSDTPVTIGDVESKHQGASRLVRVSQVAPRVVTRIFIPTESREAANIVRVANGEAVGVTIRRDDNLESPLKVAQQRAAFVALGYAVVMAILGVFLIREIRELRREAAEARQAADEAKAKMREADARISKVRILLQARLFDYSKELSFWRNAVRQILLKGGADVPKAESVIESVTQSLGTQGTMMKAKEDFQTLRIAAAWLRETEKPENPQ